MKVSMKGVTNVTNTWTIMRTLTRQRSLSAFKTFIVTLVATAVSLLVGMFSGEAKITLDLSLSFLFGYAVLGGQIGDHAGTSLG